MCSFSEGPGMFGGRQGTHAIQRKVLSPLFIHICYMLTSIMCSLLTSYIVGTVGTHVYPSCLPLLTSCSPVHKY